MTFKYIELFAGIGGFRQALDTLGGECIFASEIDPFATKAYTALYGGTELHGDITKIDAQDIPDHDVLVGGFPCQAFSVAGQRKGFEEARGTLFFEIARIASAKQPRLMLLENVKGLLSHDGGNTFETMCAVLNDIGYAIDFRVLNSKHYGVPQNRERIFVVCDRGAEHTDWNIEGNGVEARAKRRAQALGIRTFNFGWPADNAVTTRLRDVLEAQVDEKYYLSEEKTTKLVAQLTEKGMRVGDVTIDMKSETSKTRAGMFKDGYVGALDRNCNIAAVVPIIAGSLDHYGNDQMNRVYSVDGVAPTITVVSGGGREQKIAEPIIEKVGHLPSDSGQTGAVYSADGIAPTILNQHGNAVTKIAVECVGNVNPSGNGMNGGVYADSGLSPTLTTNKGEGTKILTPYTVIQKTHSTCTTVKYDEPGTLQAARLDKVPQVVVVADDGLNRKARVREDETAAPLRAVAGDRPGTWVAQSPRYRIRKLTPLECWRLQGFSDAAHNTVADAGISDSQRYKQAGNAVTVNVISAIGRRLVKRLIPLLTEVAANG